MRRTVEWYLEDPQARGAAVEPQLGDAFAYEAEDRLFAALDRAAAEIAAIRDARSRHGPHLQPSEGAGGRNRENDPSSDRIRRLATTTALSLVQLPPSQPPASWSGPIRSRRRAAGPCPMNSMCRPATTPRKSYPLAMVLHGAGGDHKTVFAGLGSGRARRKSTG